MAECIERKKVYADISRLLVVDDIEPKYQDAWETAIIKAMSIVEKAPAVDAHPERHGHIIWKERHSGGFRHRECLSAQGFFMPPCNKIATIDDRCIEKRPYCSECGKLLDAVFSNYCGNCGAKMDGKEVRK